MLANEIVTIKFWKFDGLGASEATTAIRINKLNNLNWCIGLILTGIPTYYVNSRHNLSNSFKK